MPPFAGEGVNMAMLDALELSETLTSSQCNTIESAIFEYETNMFKRASKIAQNHSKMGKECIVKML